MRGEVSLRRDAASFVYGSLGVVSFSLTLPATKVAVVDLGGTVVGLGRALVAAGLAALLLRVRRERWPSRAELPSLIVVAAGVVVGFPLLSAWAIRLVPASHGAVVTGLLPLATAVMAATRAGERPSWTFWLVSAAGLGAVLVFAATIGGGAPRAADSLLLGAVAAAGLGYAEGARLARTLGDWQVICWALLLSAPVVIWPVAWWVATHGLHARPGAWLGFAYVSVVSMFLGFFAWYRGLALGGIAKVGQLQLAQPVLTLAWSALLLGETLTTPTVVASIVILALVALGRRARVGRATAAAQ
ncbi:MAG: EamA family transporter [Candidatus Rokuibacteriota bacterium]|nr:MAG: EamA family transporter [Candidatus Rokubacteria bacterium]